MSSASLFILISLISVAAGVYLAFHTLYAKTTTVHLTVPRMPTLTLIHLSDLHGRTKFLNGRLHRLVNRWKPDVICVTGDLAQNRGQLASVMAEMAKLESRQGVYFVPGNYEREEVSGGRKRRYTAEEYAACKKQWQAQMQVLENEACFVQVGEARLCLYGFDNSTYGNERFDACSQHKPADCTVLLAHSPKIISLIREKDIHADLLLTGHTHGGQIRLFGKTLGAYKHFHIGQRTDERVGLFAISRGLGTSRLPLRLNCFPEITVYLLNHP
ncbi:metallophosphoesterase [Brevibacillus sp. GCM10020057]|uniref:metallophosphoesterase n=1 Tax=Brevibacillus sp. GCM10020057 TaxID=3317327 RepID=UPI00362B9157